MLRALRSLVLTVGALTVLQGCVPDPNMGLEDIGYADRIRLDRASLEGLADQDLEFGLYSDGLAADGTDSRLVSELYVANISGPRMSNLPLSNCLWLGTDASGSAGDTLAMSWEGVATFLVEDEVTPNPLRMCRLADEINRYNGVSVGSSAQAIKGHSVSLPSLNLSNGGRTPAQTGDLHFLGAILSAHSDPDPDPDVYGRCPVGPGLYENGFSNPAAAVLGGKSFSFTGDEVFVPQHGSYNCLDRKDNSGETTFCGKRCAYRPPAAAGDALSLRLGVIDELDVKSGDLDIAVVPENRTPRWMRPNLLLARGTRTIARPMRRLGSGSAYTYQWKTPVAGSASAPTLQRWHENFSPNVVVAAVRFFRLEPGGTELPLDDVDGDGTSDIADNRVALLQMGTFTTCSGVPNASSRTFAIVGCAAATPTYLHDHLQSSLGDPLTEPLAWQVTFLQDPLAGGSGEVYMEIDLEAEFGEAGMQGRPLVVDLGEVPVDRRASDWLEIVNLGGPRLVVDQLALQGPDAAELSFQLPINPRPIAIPVDFTEEDGRWRISLGEDFEVLPLMERWEDEEQQLTVARPLVFERQVVDFYGDQAVMEDGLIVALDPAATFAPRLQQGVYRPAVSPAFDIQTLPVELATGDTLRVRVSALPRSYSTYPKTANLHVWAHPSTDPSRQMEIDIALRLRTMWGPDAHTWPESTLVFDGEGMRNALLDSYGDQPLLRTWIGIEGPDFDAFDLASQNPATKVLQPGETEAFTVEYTHPSGAPCGSGVPLQEATLRIVTDVGDQLVDLRGGRTCPP